MKKFIPYLLVLLFVGLGGSKYYTYKNSSSEVIPQKVGGPGTYPTTGVATISVSGVEESNDANIQVEEPVNGKTYGIIEVGASGFNSFIVEADVRDNYKVISKEFGESLAYEGFITSQDVQSGLKKYLTKMFNEKVPGKNIHFIVSSGANKNEKTKLVMKAIQDMGYVVFNVTAEQEGKYALKALIPRDYKTNSFAVDMGSGNTKVSWYEGDNLKTIETYGAKYTESDGVVYNEVAKLAQKVPTHLRKNMFIIGGVPFELAKQTPASGRYVLLKTPGEYEAKTEKIKAGLNIYSAILDNNNVGQVVWDWDANFTMGYILSIN